MINNDLSRMVNSDLQAMIAELMAEIKFLQNNPRPIETLLESEVEHLQTRVEELEAELRALHGRGPSDKQ